MEVKGNFKNHSFLTRGAIRSNQNSRREMYREGKGFRINMNSSTENFCVRLGTNIQEIFNSKLPIESDKVTTIVTCCTITGSKLWTNAYFTWISPSPLSLDCHQWSSLAKCDAHCSILTFWDTSAAVETMDDSLLLGTLSALPL